MDTVSLEQQLARLRRDYLATLPGHARTLAEAWRMLCHVRWDEAALTRLQKEAHYLAGSGGTFGFDQLTELGRALAQALEQISADSNRVTAARRKSLEQAVNATVAEIERILQGRSRSDVVAADENAVARIAILDHDPIQARRLRLWCEAWGHDVSVFLALPPLLEVAAGQPFDLVLADPLSFDSVTDLIRDLQGAMATPVLIMSARTDVTSRLEALRAGASGYMVRPLDDEALQAELDRILVANRDNRPRVLFVDDDKDVCAYYQRMLEHHGFEVRTLSKPMAVLDVMARFQPDILVVDYHMPGMNGAELARLLHQDPEYLRLPVIFVSARPEVGDELPSLNVAEDDFLLKPLDDQALLGSLRRGLARARALGRRLKLISGRQDDQSLQNRPRFFQQLEKDLSRCRIADKEGGDLLLFLSVDKPDFLRQRHGLIGCSQLGHQVERWLAAQPGIAGRGCVISDLAWLVRLRMDGDGVVADVAETLRSELAASTFEIAGSRQNVSFSAGGVSLSCELPNAEQVTRAVEKACDQAARAGGGRTVLAAINGEQSYRPLEARLGKALQARSFALQYQPVVNLETNSSFFQALVRLRDDEGNLYLPEEFLASVPQYLSDGIVGLDRWVIEAAVDALGRLQGREAESSVIVIKLSSGIEGLTRLLPFIGNVMQNSRLRGERRLLFAFREGFTLEHLDQMKGLLARLVRLNIGIVIENFGSGKHGRELLDELPNIDFLRLDPSWNRRVFEPEATSELLEMLHARFSGMDRVIACHVEEAKTFSAFWDLGIRHFQGFFVQQPGDAMMVD